MSKFKFSVGPWNVHTGADSYGPETRQPIDLETKFAKFAELGFSAVQFHDDDAVPDMNNMTEEEIKEYARGVKKLLDKYGLAAEFVAPRLWMDPHTKDGGFMSTRKEDREFALWRAYRSIDIANELGFTKPSISRAVGILKGDGYITVADTMLLVSLIVGS